MSAFQQSRSSKVFDFANHVMLIFLSLAMIYPFVYVFSISISDPLALQRGEVIFLPVGFDTTAYEMILSQSVLLTSYWNTIYYSVFYTIVVLFLTSITAYPLAMKIFCMKKFITVFLLLTMFFSGGLIPLYILLRSLGMLDTVWSIVLPAAISVWNIIIFRTFFQGIPESLRESALMDGANDTRILFTIYLPLSKPIIATIALFSLVAKWNDFFGPFIFLTDSSKYPLTILLRRLLIQGDTTMMLQSMSVNAYELSIRGATIIVSVLPIMIVYPFLQKYFVKGMMIGSLKG